ncbi:unnamed protein product [marine sediment metagenome]|uniref:Uncharacterized protein n=1 Tax=marine sediment metagenome TaxID=412755 RepID=X1A7P6_9ZZZZ
MFILIIGFLVGAMFGFGAPILFIDSAEKRLCEHSKYATSDYDLINGQLYCKDSGNGYQLLTKPKVKSVHLEDHKSD